MPPSSRATARRERWTERPLTVLALLLIPVLLAPIVFHLSSETEAVLNALDYLIWGAFAADLIAKLAIAQRRLRYLRARWVDVALVALPVLRPLRRLRSARALQLLRLGWVAVVLGRFAVGGRRTLYRHGLHYALALVVLVLGHSPATAVKHAQPGATVPNLPDGLWWAVTTVGYGDTYPKTAVGRGVGVARMLLGISLFSGVAANVTAFFVEEREDERLADVRALRRALQILRQPE